MAKARLLACAPIILSFLMFLNPAVAEVSKKPSDCDQIEKVSVSLVQNVRRWMQATLPEIKLQNLKALSQDAQTLRKNAPKCPEKVKVTDFESSFFIEYKVGNIKQDVFNFNSEGLLASWVRDATSGKSQALKFQNL